MEDEKILEVVIQALKNVTMIHQVDLLTNTQLIEAIVRELEEPEKERFEVPRHSGLLKPFTEKELEIYEGDEYYD